MTSSDKHLNFGQPKWNTNTQKYKEYDVFLENGLFTILVVAHGRHGITRRSLLSSIDCINLHKGEVEWIFVENGNDDHNYSFFQELPFKRKVVLRQSNFGINHALNQGWALSRGEYIMIHENDWEATRQVDIFGICNDIFTQYSDVGIIQLRDPFDPNENFGAGKPEYNPWSCHADQLVKSNIKLWREKTTSGHEFMISNFPNGFNNNPVVIRKQVYRECGPYPEPEVGYDPRHGETLYQSKVAALGCAIAHIGLPIYRHIGRIQTVAS